MKYHHRAGGYILITTLWILAILSVMALSLAASVRLHMVMTQYAQDESAVAHLLDNGGEYARYVIAKGDLKNYPYCSMPVDDPAFILSSDERLNLFISETGGKLDVNSVKAPLLKSILFQITNNESEAETLAGNIEDWRDADDQGFAEASYYEGVYQPHSPRNDDLCRLEELLYVKDMTPRIFYGEDSNANGILDSNEDDGSESFPDDNRDGILQFGLRDCLAVRKAKELNINSVPEHVWSAILYAALEDSIDAAEAAKRIIVFRAGNDRLLGTPDDQQFATVEELKTILNGYRENLYEAVSGNVSFKLEPEGYEAIVQAAIVSKRIVRSARITFAAEEGALKIIRYQEL